MENLLNETIEFLKEHNLSESDVRWVGCIDFKTSWENFKDVANKEYSSGYGWQKVASDLLVVGDNWWLERWEYDGSEGWSFKQFPKEPQKTVKLKRAISNSYGWKDLKEMNLLI